MASKKYYAVKQGRKTGIFNSWEDCRKQVEGFPNAIYKGFSSSEEAQNYLKPEGNNNAPILKAESKSDKTLIAYVDGSFSEEQNKYSYGCVLLNDKVIKLSGIGDKPEITSMRNIAGELLGAMKAINWAYENNYKTIVIYHDYNGIEKWATGEWKAKQDGTKRYVDFIKNYKKNINIEFSKVDAHSGDIYNEEADRLAREALIESRENNNFKEIERRLDIDRQRIDELFGKIMKAKDRAAKNMFSYKYNDYFITDSKLKKFVHSVWELYGQDVPQIDLINLSFDIQAYNIKWEVKDKKGEILKFDFTLK